MSKQNSFDASCNDFDTFIEKLSHLVPDEKKANSLITLLDFMVNGSVDSIIVTSYLLDFLHTYGYKTLVEYDLTLKLRVERNNEHA